MLWFVHQVLHHHLLVPSLSDPSLMNSSRRLLSAAISRSHVSAETQRRGHWPNLYIDTLFLRMMFVMEEVVVVVTPTRPDRIDSVRRSRS